MTTFTAIEYSVCEDCLLTTANGDEGGAPDNYDAAVAHELGGRNGHFSCGVEATEDDPDGNGYDEFSSHPCELCGDTLAGSRHGLTLLLEDE